MKKTTLLFILFFAAVFAAAETPSPAVSFYSRTVRLQPGKGGVKLENPAWRGSSRQFHLESRGNFPCPTWRKFSAVIRTLDSGRVTWTFGGNWARKPEERRWFLCTDLRINGALAVPDNLCRVTVHRPSGQLVPDGVWLHPKARYLADGGPWEQPALRVNFDCRGAVSFPVQANREYRLTALFRQLPPEEE